MKRVLIPVDGSDCSLRAGDYVIAEIGQRAQPEDVEVRLLNVQVALRGDIGQFFSHGQIEDYQREESEKGLGQAQSRLAAAGVRPVKDGTSPNYSRPPTNGCLQAGWAPA